MRHQHDDVRSTHCNGLTSEGGKRDSQEINDRGIQTEGTRELLSDLHAGKDFESAKARFEEVFKGVSAAEIAEAEQALITGAPVER